MERDPAGNESEPSDPWTVIVDTTPPGKPSVDEVIDDEGAIQGPVGNGESTDDTTPTLVGKGEPGDTIIVIDNGTPIGETQVDEEGNWSFTPDTPLDEGEHEFTLVERDPAGNESEPSDPWTVIVDTTPPGKPSIDEVVDDEGAIQGPVGNGESTDDTTPTLVGKGEPGDTIIVIDNGTPIGETQVDEDGNWSFTPETPLDEGEHEFTLVERDPAGNESEPSDPWTVIVDTTPPGKPSIDEVIDDEGAIQGPVGNGESTDDTTPTLVGKGEPGDTIIVIDNGTPIGETQVDEEGNWSFTPDTPLDEGEHEFTLVERDPAGNESEPSDPWTVIVDTTPPGKPSVDEVIDDKGAIQGPVGNGESTDDTTPTLVGKGEPGDTIIVIDNGTPIGETQVDEEGNWSFTPDTPLDEGEHEFTLVERDPAGNESRPSDPWTVIVDTTPPGKPSVDEVIDDEGAIQGPVGNGESTDDTTPTLVGKGEPGDTIIVIDNGTPIGETQVDEEGNWSFTPETPLDEGEHEFTLVERDPAGNESEPSDPWTVIVDTTPPGKPSIDEVIDDEGAIQGPVGNGESTDDTTPTLVGKGEPGDTIIVIDNGTPIGETQVDEEGNWSFTPDTPLDEGEHEFTLVERDPAGNESEPSDPWTVIVDTTPPGKPSVDEVIDDKGAIQGPVGNGESTDDTTPTLVGKGEPGDTIIVIDNGTPIGETQVDEEGNWSFTPDTPLDEGEHEFTLVERDPAGNESEPSDPWTVIVDTTPPGKPSVDEVIDDKGAIQGPVGNGESTDDTTPTLVGKGEPGDTIIVIDNGTPIGETQVDEEGNWSFTPDTPLDEGEHEFTLVERDPAGNESEPSDPWTVIVDTTPPGKPSIDEVVDDEGAIQGPVGNGESTDDTTPTLVGKGEPGDTIIVIDNGTPIGETQVDEEGNWSFTPDTPLDEGEHEFTLVERDPAGNESEPSDPWTVIVDTTPPGKPSIVEVIDDVGAIQGPINNGDTTDDARPTLVGKGEPGKIVIITIDGNVAGAVFVDNNGDWTYTPHVLADGSHEFRAHYPDSVEGTDNLSDPWTVIVETAAPDAPSVDKVIDDVGPIQGPVAKGGVTDDARPTIEGTAEAGSTVSVYENGKLLGTVVANGSGQWSFTPSTDLADGSHNITATVTDTVTGKVSPETAAWPVTVNTSASAPVITTVTDDVGAIQGPVAKSGVTDDARPTIQGTAEAGSTVSVYENGKLLGTVVANGSGQWSFTPSTNLADGSHNFTATATNPATGKVSAESTAWPVTVNTGASAPVITTVTDDVGPIQGPVAKSGVTDDARPTIQGTAEAGSTVSVYENGKLLGTVVANGSGQWSFTPSTDLADGSHNFTATATNAATGKVSAESTAWPVTVNTSAPAPVITTVTDDVGAIQGPVAKSGVTDDARPTIQGTAEAGSTVSVYENGKLLGTVVANGSGQWSFTPSTDLADGSHNFTATATNAATGKVSAESTAWPVTVDTGASAPVITTVTDDVGAIQGAVAKGGVTDDARPTIQGTAEAGSTVSVYENGRLLGTTVANGSGQWSFTPSTNLADGSHSFTATATNPATGKVSAEAGSWNVTVDTVAPGAQPSISYMGKDAGLLSTDFLTNDGSAGRYVVGRLTASLAANEKVQVSLDGGKTWQDALVNGNRWVFQDNTTHNASWTIQTRVIDAAGNIGKIVSQDVTLDQIAPAIPDGVSYEAGVISYKLPAGTKVGDSVSILMGDHVIFQYVSAERLAEGRGGWPLDQVDQLAIQSGAVWGVRMVDEAGNCSAYVGKGPIDTTEMHIFHIGPEAGFYVGTGGADTFILDDVRSFDSHPGGSDILQGNGGIDTLKLTGAGQTLDLSNVHVRMSSVEVVDITGSGNNTLKLSLGDVLDQGGQNLFIADGRTQMMVKGNAGDKVNLSDLLRDDWDVGNWMQQSGTTTVDGVAYDVFYHSGLSAELLVQHGVDTTLLNH
ncbi:hypothetical protein OKW46_004840 [Paraburkholderia sp. WSM4179]|nr:hypothetical protein [Paraburkholderia sp. WSM4179]